MIDLIPSDERAVGLYPDTALLSLYRTSEVAIIWHCRSGVIAVATVANSGPGPWRDNEDLPYHIGVISRAYIKNTLNAIVQFSGENLNSGYSNFNIHKDIHVKPGY